MIAVVLLLPGAPRAAKLLALVPGIGGWLALRALPTCLTVTGCRSAAPASRTSGRPMRSVKLVERRAGPARRGGRAVGAERGEQRAGCRPWRPAACRSGRAPARSPSSRDPVQRDRRGAAALGPVEHQRRHARAAPRRPARCRPRWSAPRRTARRRPRRRSARARSIAASRPSTAAASVRAMSTKSGSRRAATAARILPTISSAGITALPLMCPHFLGITWSSRWMPGHAGLLVGLHRAHHVDRVAVAGVGVGDHRHVDGGDDPPGVVDHLGAGEQPDVGPAEQRGGGAEPGHVDDVEAGLLDQPRRQRVVGAGRDQRARAARAARAAGPAARPAGCSRSPTRALPIVCIHRRSLRPSLVCGT